MFDVSHQTLYIILFYKSHAAEARLGGEPLVSKFTFTRRLKRQRQAAELNVNFYIWASHLLFIIIDIYI